MEKRQKTPSKPTRDTFKQEREQRGEHAPPPASGEQLGATEKQIQPLTPPMANSDQQPNDPKRGRQPDKGIDPADELTPG